MTDWEVDVLAEVSSRSKDRLRRIARDDDTEVDRVDELPVYRIRSKDSRVGLFIAEDAEVLRWNQP